jgi:hypothetical protein
MIQEEYIVYGNFSDEELGWGALCAACMSNREGHFKIRHGKLFKRDGTSLTFIAGIPDE